MSHCHEAKGKQRPHDGNRMPQKRRAPDAGSNCKRNSLDGPKNGAYGCDSREQCGTNLPATVFVVFLLVLRLNVDNVVLLQIERRRVEHILARDVIDVHAPLAVHLADDGDTVCTGLGSKVAGIGYSSNVMRSPSTEKVPLCPTAPSTVYLKLRNSTATIGSFM